MNIFNQAQSEYKHSDISRKALCCHSNETRAAIANPPNSIHLDGTPTIPPSPSYIRLRAVVWKCGEGQRDRETQTHTHTHTHTQTQTVVSNIHFASSKTPAKCKRACFPSKI